MGQHAASRPGDLTFESQLNPDGSIKDVYKQQSQLNTQGLEAMRSGALRDPSQASRWRDIAQGQAMDQFGRQQAGQLQQAQNNLAAQGGLSSGARERLQNQAMQSGIQGKQGIWGQMAMQDEQNRLGQLAQLPGQELAAAGYKSNIDAANIGRGLGEVQARRAFDMGKYQQDMQAWGALNTANAVQVPQDKGFLGNIFEGIF
jgi:hypothetical protein